MSYFTLSPSNEVNSIKSNAISQTNFENFGRSKRERDKTINEKQLKDFRIISKFLQKYELYISILLGRDLEQKDDLKLSHKWCDSIDSYRDQILPEAVLRFPNPDYNQTDNNDSMSTLEVMLFIEKILKLDRKNLDNKIFFKAIEGVLSHLDTHIIRKSRSAFTQISHMKFTHQDLLLLDGNPQISENNEQLFDFTQKKQDEEKLNAHKKQNCDPFQELIQKFKFQINFQSSLLNIRTRIQEFLDIDYYSIKRLQPKKLNSGGFLKFENGRWTRSNQDTQDIQTLLRQVIIIQLMLNGFNIKSFISKDGKYILSLLYANEENLKTLAEQQKIKKKLNFCFNDIFSLEPVDKRFRPLRLNNRLWKPEDYDDLSEMFLYLRPKINNLIERINFKRVAREVNQSRINNQLFQYGKVDIQDDDEQMTDEEWFSYYQYLVHLEREINKLRQKNIDSDIAALINQQLTPYELYVIRNNKNEEVKKLTKQNISERKNKVHQQEIKKYQEKVFETVSEYAKYYQINFNVNTKMIKIYKVERQSYLYGKIFDEALKVANNQKEILVNFWNLINIEKLDTYVTYSKPSKALSTTMRIQNEMCWVKYQINEEKKISLFSLTERLKIVDEFVNNLFQLNDLINKKILISFFCLNDHYELFGHQTIIKQDIEEEDFFKKKMFHLEYEWSFNILKPWSTPIIQICEYYGEKIGLYFYYTTYYTEMLLKIAFIALAINSIQWIIQDSQSELYYLLRIIFSFLQIQWTNLFVVLWQKKQLIFNLQFGQSDKHEIQKERCNYIGHTIRSIENDKLNSIGINTSELLVRMLFATSALLFIIAIYGAIMIGLYVLTTTLKDQFKDYNIFGDGFFEILVTASLNIIIIQFLDKVYELIAVHLTEFENQKSVKDYEESFILKKYILYFISYVGPLVVIAFLNTQLDLYCKPTNCSNHIQYHFATMIIWIFLFKTFKIFRLIYQVKKIPVFKYSYSSSEDIYQFIEEQSHRVSYAKSLERYGTLEDYMEIFLQNTLLSIFGYTFPFSFFLLWVQNIAQMQADRAKFIYFLQRPWPQNNSSLGVWNKILEMINYVCILTNTGQMIIDYNLKYSKEIMLVYLTFLMGNFMMNFIISSLLGQIPFEIGLFIKRQKYLIKNTIEQFQKVQAKGQVKKLENLKRFPLFKIFGSSNIEFKGQFETISSEDELIDHYDIQFMEQFNEKKKKEKLSNQMCSENNMKSSRKSYKFLDSAQRVSLGSCQKLQDSKYNLINQIEENLRQKQQQIQRQENKQVKQFTEKQKSLAFEQIMNSATINKYFSHRKYNFAFSIKIWKKQKHLLQKALEYLFKKTLLNPHKLIWTDQRLLSRNLFLKRQTVLIRNLDLRKFKIYKANQKKNQEYFKEKAKQKFRKEIKMLTNSQKFVVKPNQKDDKEELMQLKQKKNQYLNKHTWISSRKLIVIKIKGIWFSQFRKQNKKIPSVKLALDYYAKAKLIEKIRGQSDLKEKLYKALGDPTQIKSIDLNTLIKAYLSLQNNPIESFELPLSTKHISMIDYYINKRKSDIFKFVIDSFRDTFVFDWQYQKLQQFTMQYFEEELFQIENFQLIQQLNSTTWLSFDDQKKKVIIQFFQIRHEQQLKLNIIQEDNFGVSYINGKAFIRLSNIIDQVDDFYIKGYCVVKYDLSSKITLKQILKYRQNHGINYSIDDLYSFLHATLVTIKNEKCGDINLKSFILNNRQYILFRSNFNDDDDLINLAQVIMEMIYLNPIESAEKGFKKLSVQHPLKSLLYKMIYEEVTINELIDQLQFAKIFEEVDLQDDFNQKKKQKQQDFKDFLTLSIHQINMNYRMKQHQSTLYYISLVEKQLSLNEFENCKTIELGFQNYFLTHQYKILQSHSNISFMFNIILIIYIKFSTQLQLKQNFINQIQILYHALMRSIESLDDLTKQVSLNVKLEQLTQTEQKILLRRKLTRSSSQIDLQSKDRFQLIETIRKNPEHINFITKVKKELQRYCLQFQALHSLYLYFNSNFVYSAQILEDIQKEQILIIQQLKESINVIEDPEDLTPNQFNFNQQSPTLDAALKIAQQQYFCLEKEFENCPNYCCQLLYYQYLQLIVWFDGGKETFQNSYIEFLEQSINSPVFEYFSSQLKVLQRFQIPTEYINFNQNCEIGKFIVVGLKKWIEQSFFIPSNLEYSNNFELMWKQIMTYSVLEQSFENRQILCKLLQQPEEKSLKYNIFQIRIIQQLLHLDNYYPLHKKLNYGKISTKGLNFDFMKNSLINRLKYLHDEINIDSNSWFHSSGLLQFRLFYVMSLYFTFSKKHFENMLLPDNDLLILGETALQFYSHKSESDEKRIKSCSLIFKDFNVKDLKSDPKPNQINKIINSFIYLNDYKNDENDFDSLKFLLNKYGEQVKPSLIVLAIIQYYISINRKDLAEILIQQTSILIDKDIEIFENSHPTFQDDLQLLEIMSNQSKLRFLQPFDRLFHKSIDLKSLTDDHLLNLKYMIYNQFFYLDIQHNIDLLEDQIKFFDQLPPQYVKLKSIYKFYILYLNATQGIINTEELDIFINMKFKEQTAFSAIIKNILVRYYINMQEYEIALPILQDILNYLYSLRVSENFILKQETEETYTLQNNLSILQSIAKVNLINIVPEDSDDQYFHLIDEQFIQENIISYLDIITNLQQDGSILPKIHDFFKLLLQIEDQTTQSNLFKALSQLFFCYSLSENNIFFEKQVIVNYERQHQIYYKQRSFLKEKLNQLLILNELTEEENYKMNNQINIIDFILNIYEGISRGLAQSIIISWSIQSCEKALLGYKIQCKNFHNHSHYIFPQILLILSDNYIKLGQISLALTLHDQSEEELLVWFKLKKHPLKGYFFMKQGLLRPQLTELYLKYTEILLSLSKLNRLQVYEIIRGLFQFNKKLLNIFETCMDYYTLEQNLLQFTKQLDNQEQITVDIFDLYNENEPEKIMRKVSKISPFDWNGANILIDALSILLMFNQNNQFTRLIQSRLDQINLNDF